ncbi:MAG: tetratricopeptide repeat protein, partial [Bacteroidetes bacterium]|nr:tetratricopeptide repeat protein [Bacteroidota bacterium]
MNIPAHFCFSIFSVVIYFGSIPAIIAGTTLPDSLKNRLIAAGNEKRAALLFTLGEYYAGKDSPDSAFVYFYKASVAGGESGDSLTWAKAMNSIGTIHFKWGNYLRAAEFYKQSLDYKRYAGNKQMIANSLINLGNVYFIQDSYKEALDYYNEAFALFRETGDVYGASGCLNNIAKILENTGNPDDAIEHYKEILT